MSRTVRRALAGLCLLLAALIILGAGLPDRAQVNALGALSMNGIPLAPEVGGAAPALDGLDPDNRPIPIEHRQPILINFWATWCGPCITEMPALEAAYQADKATGLQVVGVNMGESAAVVAAWGRDHGLTFPLIVDPTQQIVSRYRVRGAPTSFFVDRRGIIRHIAYGALSPAELQVALAEIDAP